MERKPWSLFRMPNISSHFTRHRKKCPIHSLQYDLETLAAYDVQHGERRPLGLLGSPFELGDIARCQVHILGKGSLAQMCPLANAADFFWADRLGGRWSVRPEVAEGGAPETLLDARLARTLRVISPSAKNPGRARTGIRTWDRGCPIAALGRHGGRSWSTAGIRRHVIPLGR